MPITVLGGTKLADTTFSVANSCRFNQGDGAYMHKTIGSAGNLDRWTFSCWVKRGNLADTEVIFAVGAGNAGGGSYGVIKFSSTDTIEWENYPSDTASGILRTNRKFRDCSAWYHFVFVWDSGNATAGNRMRMYTNGVEETSFSNDSNPDQNQDNVINNAHKHEIGAMDDAYHFDGYLSEVVFIDGTAYGPTDFGEFDEDSPRIWKPKDVSGLTFGTNGFYLDFEASDNLGNDANGGTDLTEDTIDATDQVQDSPSNNFCVINPLDNYYQASTLSEGNCKIVTEGAGTVYAFNTGTIGLTAGKWYFEMKMTDSTGGGGSFYGVAAELATSASTELGHTSNAIGLKNSNVTRTGDADTAFGGDAYTDDDIMGCALDMTNSRIFFAMNGVWMQPGSATGGDPTDGTGAVALPTAVASTPIGAYLPAFGAYMDAAQTMEPNFGCPSYANSSDAADENGYGAFEYAPPSGYLAICTKNLGSDGG